MNVLQINMKSLHFPAVRIVKRENIVLSLRFHKYS